MHGGAENVEMTVP